MATFPQTFPCLLALALLVLGTTPGWPCCCCTGAAQTQHFDRCTLCKWPFPPPHPTLNPADASAFAVPRRGEGRHLLKSTTSHTYPTMLALLEARNDLSILYKAVHVAGLAPLLGDPKSNLTGFFPTDSVSTWAAPARHSPTRACIPDTTLIPPSLQAFKKLFKEISSTKVSCISPSSL